MAIKFNQQEIVNYLKNYGFVYHNSEIYNGLANSWDFGPIGTLLKNNIKCLWWKKFVTSKSDMIGIDSQIIYNSDVWKASGHLANFSDPLIDCKKCKERFRADKLIENFNKNINIGENSSNDEYLKIIIENKIPCPSCKAFDWTSIRQFNLMFKTFQGVIENDVNTLYLRPETAQGIFINFKNVLRTTRNKLPFGIAQIGKAFRNEITPGNFIFRVREFEQMEIEHFANKNDVQTIMKNYIKTINDFFINDCNLKKESLRLYNHPKEKLSHYSQMTVDFEFEFPHGWGELCGIAHRGNYDLSVHEKFSNKDLTYQEPTTNEKFLPDVVEPSIGVERLFYAIIVANYSVEVVQEKDTREVLHLPIELCPYKICVLPLTNKQNEKAQEVYRSILDKGISATYDSSGSIGKRYRRQDAIGTKYCFTIDFDTNEKNKITVRERDSMKQQDLQLDKLDEFLLKEIIKWK